MKQNVKLRLNTAQSRLTNKLLTVALAAFTGVTCLASAQPALAQSDDAKRFETPTVFQAAGPSTASLSVTVRTPAKMTARHCERSDSSGKDRVFRNRDVGEGID